MSIESAVTGTSPSVCFADLRSIDVGAHIEKKGKLSYLSWVWAVDQLLQRDPAATWEYRWGHNPMRGEGGEVMYADVPFVSVGETSMVFCTVHAFGVSRTAQLPVMDNRNQPIKNPNSFELNTAMQRCLAKAIALHGIGLYIYAGEDVPEEPIKAEPPTPKFTADELKATKDALADCETLEELRNLYNNLDPELRRVTEELAHALKKEFLEQDKAKASA